MASTTTMKRIAGELGVSITTVSKVLNNREDIGHATRARVLAKVAELGYQPNAVARSLAATCAACHGTDGRSITTEVVPLAGLLQKQGVKLDQDAAPSWLALVTDEGKMYPLVKDDGARMFFKDARLLNRPMRLTGRLVPGSELLQVVNVHSYKEGKLHEVFYWCDICSIRGYELHKCDCCGGPMDLREEPAK